MAYTPTTWVETGMSTVQKVAGLNNLETIYTEAVAAIDAITHSDKYYTKAQADAKYFTSATDGAGSGLIAATLDGWTAQQILDAGTPSGCIAIWCSTEGSIPAGWYLCDGLNGTPNLVDRFVVGAGGHYTVGDTGGSDTVTTTASNVTIGGHALTADEIPKHTHGTITDYYPGGYIYEGVYTGASSKIISDSTIDITSYTDYAGSGQSHTHPASYAGTANQDKRPPFYALCYIMKA